PVDTLFNGKEHHHSASALRHYACARNTHLSSHITRYILGARPHHGRLPCLARVGQHHKSKAQSIYRQFAALPHGYARHAFLPFSFGSTISPQYGVVPRPPILSQRTPMGGWNSIAHSMSWITSSLNAYLDHPIARQALPQITCSPRGNLAHHTEPLSTISAKRRPSWPYAARQVSKPFGDSSAPLTSCLEPALEGSHHTPKRCSLYADVVSCYCCRARGGPADAHRIIISKDRALCSRIKALCSAH
ncbi:UNVERIFIED_CONTAM: hypothetical protein Sindi_1328800, partial [Sesamum indicum]